MKLKRIMPGDYVVSEWAGGKTTQLAIAPEGAVYAQRRFLWRLSSATVELESSDFTPLPDYTRLISVLRGEMRLSHNGGSELTLRPYSVHSFDGGDATHSAGRCVDFNLMLRKGLCSGSLQPLCSDRPGAVVVAPAEESPRRFPNRTVVLFCGEGSVDVAADGQREALRAGESLLIEDAGNLSLALEWRSEVKLMLAQVQYEARLL